MKKLAYLAIILLLVLLSLGCTKKSILKVSNNRPEILKDYKSFNVSKNGMQDSAIEVNSGNFVILLAKGEIAIISSPPERESVDLGPESALLYRIGEKSVARRFLRLYWLGFTAQEDGKLYLGIKLGQTDQYGEPLKREYLGFTGNFTVDILIFKREDPIVISEFLDSLRQNDPKNWHLEVIATDFKRQKDILMAEQKASETIQETRAALSVLTGDVKKGEDVEREKAGTKTKDLAIPEGSGGKDTRPTSSTVTRPSSAKISDHSQDLNEEREKKIAELNKKLQSAEGELKNLEEMKKELEKQKKKDALARLKELPKIAVWELEARNTLGDHAKELTSILVSEITKLKKYEVYSQDNVRTLAGWTAQRMQLGCTDTRCLTALGQMDISNLISGSIGKIGNRYSVSLNLFDTENIRSVNAISEYCQKEDELIELIQQSLRKLLGE